VYAVRCVSMLGFACRICRCLAPWCSVALHSSFSVRCRRLDFPFRLVLTPLSAFLQVGVGISGKEGMQAVNNSDFAIAQFAYVRTRVGGSSSVDVCLRVLVCACCSRRLVAGTRPRRPGSAAILNKHSPRENKAAELQ
jgi:hypothetical protein